mmetsp:Transcript_59361/g.156271  ORF Transcript_59361/g.156271 Transcript_59361/m.156271 type:complete len:578 (-) Transcript_59361:126-1859(-)
MTHAEERCNSYTPMVTQRAARHFSRVDGSQCRARSDRPRTATSRSRAARVHDGPRVAPVAARVRGVFARRCASFHALLDSSLPRPSAEDRRTRAPPSHTHATRARGGGRREGTRVCGCGWASESLGGRLDGHDGAEACEENAEGGEEDVELLLGGAGGALLLVDGHERGEDVDERRAEDGAAEGDDEAEVLHEEGSAVGEAEERDRRDVVHRRLARLRLHAEHAQHSLAQADKVEREGEDDRRGDADAREEGERVGGGVVVKDEALRRGAKREEAGGHHGAHQQRGAAEADAADEVERGHLGRAILGALQLLVELGRIVVGEEGGRQHRDQHKDRRIEQRARRRRRGERGLRRRGDGAKVLAAGAVRAVDEAEHHEEHRVERARVADHRTDRERRQVAQQREGQQHEEREGDDPRVGCRREAGGAGELGDGGERVADDDGVRKAGDGSHEDDGGVGEDARFLAEDLGPSVSVRVRAHRLAHAADDREGVAGDAAQHEEEDERRDERHARAGEGGDAGCQREHAGADDVLREVDHARRDRRALGRRRGRGEVRRSPHVAERAGGDAGPRGGAASKERL